MNNRVPAVALGLLCMVPAVIVPGAENRFVFGKLAVAAVAVAVGLVAAPTGRLPRSVLGLLAGGCALLLGAGLANGHPATAWWGRAPVFNGMLVLGLYCLVGAASARLLGPDGPPGNVRLALVLDVMSVCALVVCLVAVLEAFGLRPLSTDQARPGSLLGNASDQGAFGVLYGGTLLASGLITKRRLALAGAAAGMFTTLLSASRGALAGLVVALVLLGVQNARARRVVAVVFGLAVVVSLADPLTRGRVLGLSPFATRTVGGRTLLWQESLTLWSRHPLLGVGPSQFENAIVTVHNATWHHRVGPANPPATPHNLVLQLLLAGGPLLLALAIYLMAKVVASARHRGSWGASALVGLTGYAVSLMFHFPTPGTAIPAIMLGASVLATAAGPRRAFQRATVGSATVLSGILAVIFGLASAAELELQRGDVALAAGRLHIADDAYRTARTMRPWDADLEAAVFHKFVAAHASQLAGRWQPALGATAQDIQVLQDSVALQLDIDNVPRASLLLRRAATRDPHNPDLLTMQGVVDAINHDYPAARDALIAATTIAPGNGAAWHDLALVYRALGEQIAAARAETAAHGRPLAP